MAKSNNRFFPTEHHLLFSGSSSTDLELNESDFFYDDSDSYQNPLGFMPAPPTQSIGSANDARNPNWSTSGRRYYEDDDVDEESGGRLPPHEFIARRRRINVVSSVLEGKGRTLKGRDLRMVRNSVWEKLGFQG